MDKLQRSTALVSYFVLAIFSVLLGRLFYLQVIDFQKLGSLSAINSIRRIWVEPPRGRMIDRNGKVMVDNQPLYTVMIIPDEFHIEHLPYLAKLIEMSEEELKDRIKKGIAYNRFAPVAVTFNLNPVAVARLSENLWQLPGVLVETDNKRKYADSLNGSHLFGYCRSIPKNQLEELVEQGYIANDQIGFSGLEKTYEERLRGIKGVQYEMVTPFGKYAGKYNDGKNDIPSVKGDDLYLSIDEGLQRRAEQLLRKTGKSGAVVAIDPATGGILALASAPDFSLDIFNGSTDREGWNEIVTSPMKPLIDRAVQAAYPPGSTFKMVSATAALEEKTIDPKKKINDTGVFVFGNRRFLSNEGRGHGAVDMQEAISVSSNVYFYGLIFNIGFDNWTKYGRMYGFGQKTGIDLPNERAGILPSTEYYDKRYGKDRWTKGYLVSLGIGQGEVNTTPMQLAVYAAAIGNRGTLLQPHIVNGYRDAESGRYIPFSYARRNLPVSQSTFDLLHAGMAGVVDHGTGTLAKVPGIVVAGKTGTAQNPHGRDHAWFIAYAPAENPKIALAVLVENAGFGGAISAPIARELIKYYLIGDQPPVPPGADSTAAATSVSPKSDSLRNSISLPAKPGTPATTAKPAAAATPGTAVKPAAVAKPVTSPKPVTAATSVDMKPAAPKPPKKPAAPKPDPGPDAALPPAGNTPGKTEEAPE
ncbi:MAG: penicillin-binding protein 2 [Chlorobiaceae bacterium]|nr:penicillin-binding protein 2 [Chlorobiaceae bacterium]